MKRREFIACVIAGCFAAIMPADPTYSQTTKQTATENTLAAKIKCKDFQKTSDGKWPAAPVQRLGNWTLVATPSGSVRSVLVALILLLS